MCSEKDDVRISVAEQHEQTSNEATLERSNSSTQELSFVATDSNGLSGEDTDLIDSIYSETETTNGEANNGEGSHMKIQKVPEFILSRKIFQDNYIRKPKVIAIGCFYADCQELKQTDLKIRLVRRFVQESGKSAETLLSEIKKSFTLDELEKLFEQQVITEHGEEKIVRMLFVDGCSVLQFIKDYIDYDIIVSSEIGNEEVEEICHDLFLLENQIPFIVLVILMRMNDKGFDLAKYLYYFVSCNSLSPSSSTFSRFEEICSDLSEQEQDKKQVFEGIDLPVHLLDLLRSELLFENSHTATATDPAKDDGDDDDLSESFFRRSFRNIQDLKEAGINLEVDNSRGLRSVSFSSRFHILGRLNLPPLTVDESTKQKLLNLIAHEMSPGNNDENYTVTSYVRLLDTLIDNEQDVKDLRAAHILRNNLSSDEQVAQLFNSIRIRSVPQDAYSSVKKHIQTYYERKVANWKAQFYKDYCRNPWTILALLAALAAFVFTGIQTYYTVKSKSSEPSKP